jgi:hypothetical protein
MLISPIFALLVLLCLILWGVIVIERKDKEIRFFDFIFFGMVLLIFLAGCYFQIISEANYWLKHKCDEKDKIIVEKIKEIRQLREKNQELKELLAHPRESNR